MRLIRSAHSANTDCNSHTLQRRNDVNTRTIRNVIVYVCICVCMYVCVYLPVHIPGPFYLVPSLKLIHWPTRVVQ